MYNLLWKELKLGVSPFFYAMPFLTGALTLIPAWVYFLVPLYFCFITIPNMFGGYKSQNDLIFSSLMPVTRRDMVKAKVLVIVILQCLHLIVAIGFGLISVSLYPNLIYYFFEPSLAFWGLCFVMYTIFNLFFIPMYYKTAYKYGSASVVSIAFAMLFAVGAEWLGIQNKSFADLINGTGNAISGTSFILLFLGIIIFALGTFIAYLIAAKRFEKAEI
ncbi:ABC-2 transporter permease [Paenibacillus sp. strain BS8-2]